MATAPEAGCEVFWGTGDELGQPLSLPLDGLRVREPSANPRREAIVRLLRSEADTHRGADVSAVLAEQLVAEQCIVRLARSAWLVPLLLIEIMRPDPGRTTCWRCGGRRWLVW
jgi:hypothetical protein